jgi:hypothetical protein
MSPDPMPCALRYRANRSARWLKEAYVKVLLFTSNAVASALEVTCDSNSPTIEDRTYVNSSMEGEVGMS